MNIFNQIDLIDPRSAAAIRNQMDTQRELQIRCALWSFGYGADAVRIDVVVWSGSYGKGERVRAADRRKSQHGGRQMPALG